MTVVRIYDASQKYGLNSMSVTPELLEYNQAKLGTLTSYKTEPSSIYVGQPFTATQYYSSGFSVVFKGTFSGSNYGTATNLDTYRTETGELLSTNSGSWPFTSGSSTPGEIIFGGSDQIYGNSFNNILKAYAGNDTINGGGGIDTAAYSGSRSNYTITKTATGYTVKDATNLDGTDTLSNVERLQFSDKTVALDIDGNAGQAYRLYQAAFARTPDNGGLKYWISNMDNGATLEQVSAGFLASNEFKSVYGTNPTVEVFLGNLYQNVLHRAPDAGGYDYWANQIKGGLFYEQVLIGFSESDENVANVIGVIQNGIELF